MITKHFREDYKFWKMYNQDMITQFKESHGNKPKLRVRKMMEWNNPQKYCTCYSDCNTTWAFSRMITDGADLVDEDEF